MNCTGNWLRSTSFVPVVTDVFSVISTMTVLLAIVAIAISIGGLALGLMLSNKPLKGSCGGTGSCDTCQGDITRCENTARIPVEYL